MTTKGKVINLVRRILSHVRWLGWGFIMLGLGLVLRTPSGTEARAGQTIRRILIVSLNGIGDLILCIPTLRELKKARPEAEITLMIPECGRSVFEVCPYVDKLLVIEPDLEKSLKSSNILKSLLTARAYWRGHTNQEFDLALSPKVGLSPPVAFILYFSRAPVRIGYSERLNNDFAYCKPFSDDRINLDQFLTQPLLDVKVQHEILNLLAILQSMGVTPTDSSLELWPCASDREYALRICRPDNEQPIKLLVGMCVGASYKKRTWPIERQAAIATWLVDAYDAHVVLLGGPNEVRAASQLATQICHSITNLSGLLSLRQTAAIIEACNVLLTPDTGLLHVSSAVGTPVVEISCHPKFGSPTHHNAPERFGPWHVPHRILRPEHPRPPCVKGCDVSEGPHCILEITTESVKEALSNLIAEQYGRSPKFSLSDAIR